MSDGSLLHSGQGSGVLTSWDPSPEAEGGEEAEKEEDDAAAPILAVQHVDCLMNRREMLDSNVLSYFLLWNKEKRSRTN